MKDIVAEIRGHLQTMAPHQRARLTAEQLTKAADEIERLRLTDAERAAIDRARRAFRDMDHNSMTMQQVEDYEALCGLLERFPSALSPMSLPPQPEDGDEEGEQ